MGSAALKRLPPELLNGEFEYCRLLPLWKGGEKFCWFGMGEENSSEDEDKPPDLTSSLVCRDFNSHNTTVGKQREREKGRVRPEII